MRFFAEDAGVGGVAKTDGGERSAFGVEGLQVFAQLRDVLTAEDSAIVTKEDDYRGSFLPQRTQKKFMAIAIG